VQMDNWHKTMIARSFDFNFAVDWRKDLAICLDGVRRNGPLPVTTLLDQFYRDTHAKAGAGIPRA